MFPLVYCCPLLMNHTKHESGEDCATVMAIVFITAGNGLEASLIFVLLFIVVANHMISFFFGQ